MPTGQLGKRWRVKTGASVNDVLLDLRDSILDANVETSEILLLVEQWHVLAKKHERRATNDHEDAHRRHEFDQSESGNPAETSGATICESYLIVMGAQTHLKMTGG